MPLGVRRPDCPPAIVSLVMQCLAKAPDARPQSAREILAGLEGPTSPATTIDRLRNQFSSRKRRRAAVVIAVLLVAAISLTARSRLRVSEGATQIATLVVIPFANLAGDSTQDYLAEGIANELTTALGKMTGLRVVSRTLSARYRGRAELDAQQIARDLGVSHVLHGTVRRNAGRLSISTQLINARDNSETWSEDFNRVTENLFEVEDSITRAISFTLHGRPATTALAAAPSAADRGTTNRDAYDLYLRGELALTRRGQGVSQAIQRFEQAIALDSNFARAHAGLAVALELLPIFSGTSALEVHDRVIASAERALALDSTQAEAYTALAMAYRDVNEWENSLAAHRKSIVLDSMDAHARVQYGRTLYNLRRFAAASAEFEHARAFDPYSAVASGWNGHLLSLLGRNDDAIAELQRALDIDSLNPPALFMMAEALIKAGMRDSARAVAERMVRTLPPWRPAAGVLYALLGDRRKAEATIRETRAAPWVVAGRFTTIAMIELALRDTAHALAALERAADERESWVQWGALGEHHFDPVVGSPRFTALLRRVGLDDRIFATSTEGNR